MPRFTSQYPIHNNIVVTEKPVYIYIYTMLVFYMLNDITNKIVE